MTWSTVRDLISGTAVDNACVLVAGATPAGAVIATAIGAASAGAAAGADVAGVIPACAGNSGATVFVTTGGSNVPTVTLSLPLPIICRPAGAWMMETGAIPLLVMVGVPPADWNELMVTGPVPVPASEIVPVATPMVIELLPVLTITAPLTAALTVTVPAVGVLPGIVMFPVPRSTTASLMPVPPIVMVPTAVLTTISLLQFLVITPPLGTVPMDMVPVPAPPKVTSPLMVLIERLALLLLVMIPPLLTEPMLMVPLPVPSRLSWLITVGKPVVMAPPTESEIAPVVLSIFKLLKSLGYEITPAWVFTIL